MTDYPKDPRRYSVLFVSDIGADFHFKFSYLYSNNNILEIFFFCDDADLLTHPVKKLNDFRKAGFNLFKHYSASASELSWTSINSFKLAIQRSSSSTSPSLFQQSGLVMLTSTSGRKTGKYSCRV